MVVHNGYSFSILTPDGPLPEYTFPTSSPRHTKTIYVEVPTGSTSFTLHVKPTHLVKLKDRSHRFNLSLDGFSSATACSITSAFPITLINGITFTKFSIPSPDGDKIDKRSLSFQPVQLELDVSSGQTAKNDQLGVVKVSWQKIWTVVEWEGRASLRNKGVSPAEVLGKDDVREANGLSHVTRIGSAADKPSKVNYGVSINPFSPVYRVRFVYRSRAALQTLGVDLERDLIRGGEAVDGDSESGWCGLRRLFRTMFGKSAKKEKKISFSEKK
ncbi:hypothetical protein BJ508DRAFT_326453 [Ascobolus immersus RN42]|uniref:DUF7918 domain-containing protein n=1 Tax=Ascobolus immersus RN42 TaxID=1160509 RepID=A0A3N4II41_ASCIM|nr:hypothetical protein BJ508DRAFT_326453 [Ascobolus immersus RN42]